MNKITINKAFEKYFDQIIWKIEVDSAHRLIAVETRDTESTLPSFHLLDFEGHTLGQPFCPAEKEWTMDSVHNNMLILKHLGDATPVKEGIKIAGLIGGQDKIDEIWTSYEYTLGDVYDGYISLKHRTVSHGRATFLCLDTWQVSEAINEEYLVPPLNHVSFPISYPSCPPFLASQNVEGQLWLNSIGPNYIWSYHINRGGFYDLMLGVSDQYQLLSERVILSDMSKMVLQPYFQIEHQLFFLSYNKREIVSYLV